MGCEEKKGLGLDKVSVAASVFRSLAVVCVSLLIQANRCRDLCSLVANQTLM